MGVYRKSTLSALKGWKWYPAPLGAPEVDLDVQIEFRK
jgi:hypothetical protein